MIRPQVAWLRWLALPSPQAEGVTLAVSQLHPLLPEVSAEMTRMTRPRAVTLKLSAEIGIPSSEEPA